MIYASLQVSHSDFITKLSLNSFCFFYFNLSAALTPPQKRQRRWKDAWRSCITLTKSVKLFSMILGGATSHSRQSVTWSDIILGGPASHSQKSVKCSGRITYTAQEAKNTKEFLEKLHHRRVQNGHVCHSTTCLYLRQLSWLIALSLYHH